MLHPRHKLAYFKRMNWEEDWIATAREIVLDEYKLRYNNGQTGRTSTDTEDDSGTPGTAARHAKDKGKARATHAPEEINIFDALESFPAQEHNDMEDELVRYLNSPPEPITNALLWWHDRRKTFPNLSRMALDYLAIPGTYSRVPVLHVLTFFSATSVAVERVFSTGRLLLPHVRNRLKGESARALLCLGSWSRAGLVHPSDARKAAVLEDLEGEDSDVDLGEGWDKIDTTTIDRE